MCIPVERAEVTENKSTKAVFMEELYGMDSNHFHELVHIYPQINWLFFGIPIPA